MAIFFTWNQFDKSVEEISKKCRFYKFSGIYGIPRGGLCLSVAISHKLNLKLLSEPLENSLIVDDVYETGITLNSLRHIKGAKFFVLFSKMKTEWWNTVYFCNENEWIVFPWEDKEKSLSDQKAYLKKRELP